jgi:hypothetical protein
MPAALFARFPLALQAVYSDLKQRAFDSAVLLLGTPGTVSEKIQDGRRYFFRQFYDSEGAKATEYIGPVDLPEAAHRAEEIRDRIAAAKALIEDAQTLGRAGYSRADARTEAVLVSLANADFFRAGGMVIGSHGLAAILNDLGARTPSVRTEDLDVVRRAKLALEPGIPSFQELLERSRVPLSPIQTFDRKAPSTSFAVPPRLARGARFRVDLLAPTTGEPYRAVPVPELKAHALGMPHFRYLLEDPVRTIVLGRSAMIPVNVPRPERLAWHKLLVSELRDATSDKKTKDRHQAAMLIALLTIDEPERLAAAYRAMAPTSRKKMRPAVEAVKDMLAEKGHDHAAALVQDLV